MNWRFLFVFAAPLVIAAPAFAQANPPAMQMTWLTALPQAADEAPPDQEAVDHSQMDHSQMGHGAMDHSQMGHGAMQGMSEVGNELAPEAPADHAAERFYSADEMAEARAQLRREHGGAIISSLMLDRAEFANGDHETVFQWEGEGWIGGDLNRLVFKTEGEANEDDVKSAEVQALYSRAIGPYFDLQAGVRYDIEPSPNRAYAVIGIEGVAPYWFETTGALFVSHEAEVSARLEGYYDARLTQRLILQPSAEINVSAEDVPELGLGQGVTDAELGLRLRYDITRTFAPYIGVSYETKFGGTADYARAAGDDTSDTRFLIGLRARL